MERYDSQLAACKPLFQITEVARQVARAEKRKNVEKRSSLERLAVDAAFYKKYQPKRSAIAQLVDLEEDMAQDDFDYSVFLKKEDPLDWKIYKNEPENEDLEKLEGFLRLKCEPVALWSERQAREKNARCPRSEESGLVAIWQVMMALGVTPKLTMEDALKLSFHRKREDTSPLPQYLFSCSRHGMSSTDLLKAIETLSNGRVSGRFFEFYPPRRVDIRYWLAGWMKRGVVPLATLNYQKPVRGSTEEERKNQPRDWHHHMVYGVSYDGINLTNPISKMKAEHFKTRLESESVVMIPRDEVLGRMQGDLDYSVIVNTPEWKQMNVVGQIEVVSREEERFNNLSIPCGMKHIAIPSAMVGGIMLFAHKDTENHRAIMSSEEVFLKI